MRRTLRLRPSLLSIVLVASLALVACESGEGGTASPSGTAPIVPSATVTLTASPTATPEPTATPDVERRTGDPEVDAIIEAVEERDVAALASMTEYTEIGCTTAMGMGGPPKCEGGDAEGTTYLVLPVSACEGGWRHEASGVLGEFAGRARGAWGVFDVTSTGDRGDLPPVDTLVVFHSAIDQSGETDIAVYLELFEGKIRRTSLVCFGGIEEMFDHPGYETSLVAGTWDEPTAAPAVPQTGIEALDATLASVATYDYGALFEDASRAMQDTPTVACATQQMDVGTVECDPKNGEVDGAQVHVFPSAYCHGTYARSPEQPLRAFLGQAPVLHSIYEAPSQPSQSANFPHGAYWVVYELTAPDAFPEAVRAHVAQDGAIVVMWYGCEGTLEAVSQGAGPQVEFTLAE